MFVQVFAVAPFKGSPCGLALCFHMNDHAPALYMLWLPICPCPHVVQALVTFRSIFGGRAS